MGEKIRNLSKIRIGKAELLIEENKGTHKGSRYDIHIQNKYFRLNVTEQDFCKIACCILYANENLKYYKNE